MSPSVWMIYHGDVWLKRICKGPFSQRYCTVATNSQTPEGRSHWSVAQKLESFSTLSSTGLMADRIATLNHSTVTKTFYWEYSARSVTIQKRTCSRTCGRAEMWRLNVTALLQSVSLTLKQRKMTDSVLTAVYFQQVILVFIDLLRDITKTQIMRHVFL